MDEVKDIGNDEIDLISARHGFNRIFIVKDYYLTLLLFMIKDIEGIFFKGGTALQKVLLNHSRISEDIDLTLKYDPDNVTKIVQRKIRRQIEFGIASKGWDTKNFQRMIVPYSSSLGSGEIFLDMNAKAKINTGPAMLEIRHFYSNIPSFTFPCLSIEEMIAEKVAAAIGRNKPRDIYDVYKIIKQNHTINMDLVRMKCISSGTDPDIRGIFKNSKILYKRWESDILPLVRDEISFLEVIKVLKDYFLR